MGGGDPGLAGTGRPQDDHLVAGAQGVEIFRLAGGERLDRRRFALGLEFQSLDIDDIGAGRATGFDMTLAAVLTARVSADPARLAGLTGQVRLLG